MPLSLSTSFVAVREFDVLVNAYTDGSSQRRVLISNGGDRDNILDRRRWRLSKRLAPESILALRNFYDARKGGSEAFYFYDPFEGVGFGNYDESGLSTDGRFVVHFVGEWQQTSHIRRSDFAIELVELALMAGSGTADFTDTTSSAQVFSIGF